MPTKEHYKQRKQQGLCTGCGGIRDIELLKCSNCVKSVKKYQKKQRRSRKNQSLCTICGEFAEDNFNICLKCRENNRIRDKNKRKELLMDGICTSCKTKQSLPDQERCKSCVDATKNAAKLLKTDRLATNLCVRCGKEAEEGFLTCKSCLERREKDLLDKRNLVFQHYGLKCNCCKESIFEFLTIDHIQGNGSEHVKEENLGNGGSELYVWLIRNNYPAAFQTLCFNCNMAKYKNTKCPHYYLTRNLCLKCHENTSNIKGYCKSCYENLITKKYRIKYKLDALEKYGKVCYCCGQDNYLFLSIDHILNNGREESRKLKYNSIYLWLKQNNHPDRNDLRVACYNCNCGRNITKGECPHKK